MAVVEQIIRERFDARDTPLEESLLVDFAIRFAQAFPPLSLRRDMPEVVSCAPAGLISPEGSRPRTRKSASQSRRVGTMTFTRGSSSRSAISDS